MKDGLEGDKSKLPVIICQLLILTFHRQEENMIKRQHILVQRANELYWGTTDSLPHNDYLKMGKWFIPSASFFSSFVSDDFYSTKYNIEDQK